MAKEVGGTGRVMAEVGHPHSPPTSASERHRQTATPIRLELTAAQVNQVVRAASADGIVSGLLLKAGRLDETWSAQAEAWNALVQDPGLSGGFLQGLQVLATLPSDGSYLGVVALARIAGFRPSTAHRYVSTLVAAGLAERDTVTRKYRRAIETEMPEPGSAD